MADNIIPFNNNKSKKQRKGQTMSTEDYIDALNTVEQLTEEVRPHQLETVRGLLHEMRFCACFNEKFREETSNELQELIDNLYAETQATD